jgi:2-oxoglutarate ferredoxin oxidoreductase subunit beta
VYGKNRDKGLRLNPRTLTLESVTLGEDGVTEADLVVHDETNPVLAQLLVTLDGPVAMGIIHRREAPAFDASFAEHKPALRRQRVRQLLHKGNILDRR